MKKILIIIVALSLMSCATIDKKLFDGWSKSEKIWYGAFTVLNVADTLQTQYIMNHPERYREMSPLYSRAGTDGGVWIVSLALQGAILYLCNEMPEYRGWVLGFGTGGKAVAVASNREIGVQFWGED